MLLGSISSAYSTQFEELQKILLSMNGLAQDIPCPETATYTDYCTLAAMLEKVQNAHGMMEQWTKTSN